MAAKQRRLATWRQGVVLGTEAAAAADSVESTAPSDIKWDKLAVEDPEMTVIMVSCDKGLNRLVGECQARIRKY